VLSYAQTLYLLPISLFGMSVAAAELPELARQGDADTERLVQRLSAGLQRIAFLVVPSAIGYLVLGDVIVAALYQRGSFTRAETVIVAATLGAYSVGLIAATATRLLSSAFFALHDTKTPARIAVLRVLVAGAIGGAATVLIHWQRPDLIRYGAIALAAATGVAAWLEWVLLRRRLARRLGHVPAGRQQVIRMIVAASVAAVIGRVIYVMLPAWPAVIQAAIVLAPFGLGYFALAHALGVEVPALTRMLRVVKN
jgi:putative peptidoglycan lipid II flippase